MFSEHLSRAQHLGSEELDIKIGLFSSWNNIMVLALVICVIFN